MGRRRVLVLAPAITRMRCMNNPYERVKDGSRDREEVSTSFWSSWRKRNKSKRKNVGTKGRSRSWGFRVTSKLTIRILSPVYWMKKLRDSYINLMLALERSAPSDCSGMVIYAAPGGGAWVRPTFTSPVVY